MPATECKNGDGRPAAARGKCWACYQRTRRRKLRKLPIPNHVHGTVNGYTNYGCRCEKCARAKRRSDHVYERKRGRAT